MKMDYIQFDWAIKRMLRDKANFAILEGLISVLLGKDVRITEVLESEGNQQTVEDKFNRVDLICRSETEEIFIVEVQLTRDLHFMKRILYGTSKAITEHIKLGESYKKVKKIISINVLYFDLGQGADYLYHGKTTFTGCFKKDELKVKSKEKAALNDTKARFIEMDVFPEYYLIRVNQFNEVAKTPIEEWISFLKSGVIRKDTTTPGLKEAEEKLRVSDMTDEERIEYFHHIDAIMSQNDTIETYREEGKTEGLQQGLERGRTEGIQQGLAQGRTEGLQQGVRQESLRYVKEMKEKNIPIEVIMDISHLSREEIEKL